MIKRGPPIVRLSTPFARPSGRRKYASQHRPLSRKPSEIEVQSARAYCSNLLRKYDLPSFTLHAFVPSYARDAFLAIRSFNIETAQVADATSTATSSLMRMQFWRDAVSQALDGTPPREPVAILIAKAAEDLQARTNGQSRLSKAWFNRIINARERQIGNPPYPSLDALETYAENTYSTLLYLTLSALPLASVTADHVASHIGKAMGIAAVLRGVPLVAFPQQARRSTNNDPGVNRFESTQQGAVLLPLDIIAENSLKEEDVLRQGASAPGLRDSIFAVATRANDHLITAREMVKNLQAGQDPGHEFEHQNDEWHQYDSQQLQTAPKGQLEQVETGFGVLMAAVPTQMWLDKLQKLDFDIFHPSLRTTDWNLSWKTYWSFNRRRL